MSDKTIYELDLHETLDCNRHLVRRVPGGWLYISRVDTVFVPFHDEFQENRAIDRDTMARLDYDSAHDEDIQDILLDTQRQLVDAMKHIDNLNYQLEQATKAH